MSSLHKNAPNYYPDWDKYNPEFGHGQLGRFLTKALICTNAQCHRFNNGVSEEEAFYLFAKQGLFKRLKFTLLPSGLKSLYLCPFCGRTDSLHPENNDLSTS